ncbi:MAG: hypothetical protein Q9M28_05600 [Mariprofundaceae bacterium]|nr:hypothetical protein [Mariprofundaceae bacterium]
MITSRYRNFWYQLGILSCCAFLLGACAKPNIAVHDQKIDKPMLTIQEVVKEKPSTLTGIGPYTEFSGRLLVIQKAKRWQVMVNWKAQNNEAGWLRLHHAASSRIIEIKWHDNSLQTRDNHDPSPVWKNAEQAYLKQQGINISPSDLATFLLGHVPEGFSEKSKNEWRGHRGKSLLRVVWNPNSKKLIIMDMYQGSKIVLLIS